MSTLYLIRGISGSGKSTFAEQLRAAGLVDIVFENDQFRIVNGEYVFRDCDTEYVVKACRDRTAAALAAGKSVAVANAFIRKWEMAPYLDLAKQYNARVVKLVMADYHGTARGTPADKLAWMRRRFELW